MYCRYQEPGYQEAKYEHSLKEMLRTKKIDFGICHRGYQLC